MNKKKGMFQPVPYAAVGLLLFAWILSACGLGSNAKPTPTLILSEGVGIPNTGPGGRISVVDQQIVGQTVSIARVESDGPGWVVIYSDENGAPGAVLAYSPVASGADQDIKVEFIDVPASDRVLHARLHVDDGVAGTFEWPGADEPVELNGEIVQVSFRTTLSALPGSSTTAATLAPETSPTPAGQSPAPGQASVDLQLVAEGFTAPVALVVPRTSSGLLDSMALFVVDQVGLIWIIDGQGGQAAQPFLDLRDRIVPLDSNYDERGLLSMAFSPTFDQDGRFFVYYSAPLRTDAPGGWNHTAHISEFRVSESSSSQADPLSERILLQVDQPQANNNGGKLVFGPDNYLYIALGDGGGENDAGEGHVEDWYETNPGGNAQNITETLLGKILRIDINSIEPYGIPFDNPFVNQSGLEEIYAFGFRNPYSLSFDAGGDRQLYAADVGQNRWEEINLVEKGGNYGWNVREGRHCFNAADPNSDLAECPTTTGSTAPPLVDPILEYPNARREDGVGLAVIGGYVYRGRDLTNLRGSYIFGDWSKVFGAPDGSLFIAFPARAGGEAWDFQELFITNRPDGRLHEYVLAFGQDNLNDIYLLTSQVTGPGGDTGKIYRLVPSGQARPLVTPTHTTAATVRAPAATLTSTPQTPQPTTTPTPVVTTQPTAAPTSAPQPSQTPSPVPVSPTPSTTPTAPTPTPSPSVTPGEPTPTP